MKHNLKTFPKAAFPVSQMTPAELLDHILKLVTWKSHFKEELRDYIEFVDRAKRTHGLIEGEPIEIKYKIYKDVLGEK